MSLSTELRGFLRLADETLRFNYQAGAVTPIARPHGTGWRRCDGLAMAQCVNGYVCIQREGHPDVTTKKGELFAILPNVHHSIELVSSGQAYSRWAHVNFFILDSIDAISLFELPLVFTHPVANELGDIAEELGAIRVAENQGTLSLQHIFRRKALGFRMLTIFADASALKPGALEKLAHAQRIAPALTLIHEHLADDLSRDALAARVHLSPSRFQTVFREATGLAPRNYVQRQRIGKAQQLLATSELSVREIAQRVGHPDAFHFSRIFTKVVGQNPTAYRAKAKQHGAM